MGDIWIFVKSFVIFKRRVLIIKRSDYSKIGKGEWDIPGGRIQFGETLQECLHLKLRKKRA